MSAFLTPLVVQEIDEFAGTWQLQSPLVYQSDVLGKTVTAPAGFVTDFASVPRILGIYDLEGGRCNKAATIHDLLYTLGSAGAMQIDRATADAVLREAIRASGYSAATAAIFYAAVRAGGASHWKAPNQPQPAGVAGELNLPQAAALAMA
jgi:hypothetical protein